MSELGQGSSFQGTVLGVNVGLACIDCVIAASAFVQMLRIHSRNSQLGWSRQKVFHLMISSSNFGYFLYFVFTLVALCNEWLHWSRFCSFILMAVPQIVFFAAFLLLLSFWIDLCHQANDDDEEDCNAQEPLLERTLNEPSSTSDSDGFRRCFPFRFAHIGSRQKIVILVIVIMSFLLVASTVLIWIGPKTSYIESYLVAKVYLALSAIATFLLGGALAYYGFLLCSRMRRVRSDNSSSEIWKVSGLAVVSLPCFTISTLIALLPDTPVLFYWNHQHLNTVYIFALIVYYFFGLSIPSAFLLWIMRELPPPTAETRPAEEQRSRIAFISGSTSETLRGHHPQQRWTTAMSPSEKQVSRLSPSKLTPSK